MSISCPFCDERFEAPAFEHSASGRSTKCPTCLTTICLPAADVVPKQEVLHDGNGDGRTKTCPMCGASSPSTVSHCATCGESFLGEEGEIYRDGRLLVMHKTATLPYRCVKTNQDADVWLRRKLIWHSPWLYLMILFPGLLFYILFALFLQRKVTIRIPLSRVASWRRWNGIWTGWGLIFGGIALIILAAISQDGRARDFPVWFLVGGLLAIAVGAVVGTIASCVVSAKRIHKDGFVWVKGVHPDYLDQFPDWVKPK